MNHWQVSIREVCLLTACIAGTLTCVVSSSKSGVVVIGAAWGVTALLILILAPRSFMIAYGISFAVVVAAIILACELRSPVLSDWLQYHALPLTPYGYTLDDLKTISDENRRATAVLGLVLWVPYLVARIRWGMKGNEDSRSSD